jgi:hypothetical protein
MLASGQAVSRLLDADCGTGETAPNPERVGTWRHPSLLFELREQLPIHLAKDTGDST